MTFPRIEPGAEIASLTTPIVVIDEDIVAHNIGRVQTYMDDTGLSFRPHIKTHKIPDVARMQIEAGAKGINCQKISEAEVFADAGFDDILITYNILGAEKLARLKMLSSKTRLRVTADNAQTVHGLAETFTAAHPLEVLVECDTGGQRCGVQSPDQVVELARIIADKPELHFAGILTYPASFGEQQAESFLSASIDKLNAAGLPCPIVSYAGSPSLFNAHLVPSATEFRAGTYVYNDRSLIRAGHCTKEECAMTILVSVVSRPTQNRAVIDAGSKTITSDLLRFDDFGMVLDYPDASIISLNEEHGIIDLTECPGKRPEIGEMLHIIPNHTCIISNMFDFVVFHKNGVITRKMEVAARGQVW
jgi:D-serine deaminase-like pyridoxal phosphate-dependent protein